MANVIAVIWDCDKTLIDGYMVLCQDLVQVKMRFSSS